MSKQESPTKKLKEIGTEIYYQKLGDILAKLSSWRLEKDALITKFYSTPYLEILEQTKANHNVVQNQSKGLLETLYDMKETFIRFNTDSLKEKVGLKKQKQQESSFSKIKSIWEEKKENLKKLSNFVFTFYSIVHTQLSQIRKDLGTLEQQQKKLKSLKSQYDAQYGGKFEINSTKKKNKYFQLGKAQEAIQIFNQQSASYHIFFNMMEDQSTRILQGTHKFFKNLHQNLISFSKLYKKCFHDQIDNILIENARQLSMRFNQQLTAFTKNLENMRGKKKQAEQNVRKSLQSIFWTTLQQISISSWDIYIKLEQSKQYKLKKAILTMDNKLIIAQNEKKLFEMEIYLLDSQIQGPNEDGEVVVKTKKKQKFFMKFQTEAREDQFMLHYKKAQGAI